METKTAQAVFCFVVFLGLWTSVNSLLTAKGVNLEGNSYGLVYVHLTLPVPYFRVGYTCFVLV